MSVTDAPTDAWVTQQMHDATPFGEGSKYLIRDNDSKFGNRFANVAAGAQITVLKTPIRAPNANAVCKRFLCSARRECLDHQLLVGKQSISLALMKSSNKKKQAEQPPCQLSVPHAACTTGTSAPDTKACSNTPREQETAELLPRCPA